VLLVLGSSCILMGSLTERLRGVRRVPLCIGHCATVPIVRDASL
jgi:hypothetical protein